WAISHGYSRLELTVMQHNERAKRLYESCGFEVEGLKRHSLVVDGEYVNDNTDSASSTVNFLIITFSSMLK
uniref:GNAT family N-acetyltransferase n=1 Tax=Vibrio cholerae TaxID=666 RepID=UPI0020CE6181